MKDLTTWVLDKECVVREMLPEFRRGTTSAGLEMGT
jgi:hypothetical protein